MRRHMGNSQMTVMPSYYRKLVSYFPEHEMKDVRQLQGLVEDASYYGLMDTKDYLVLYGEFPEFMFIDYLLVNQSQRGSGIGSRVMKRLQSRNKTILLEVEPTDPANPDTLKRRRFYEKNGFREAKGVHYERLDENGKPFQMDLLYWSPSQQISDERILKMMKAVCSSVHNFRADLIYGRIPADPNKVLRLRD